METVKYRCKACGFAEKLKIRDFLFIFFLNLFALIGILITSVFLLFYVVYDENLAFSLFSKSVSNEFTTFAKEHDEELRYIAINLSGNCYGDFPYCFVRELYINLVNLRYIPPSINKEFKNTVLYDPIYVLNKGGDCKNTAALFVGLINSLGFDAEVVCSLEKRHCVSKIPLKGSFEFNYEEYVVADLAMNKMFVLNKDKDLWDYYE